ncbi:hypothetical protein IHE45_12G006900 [Dioscorea alata]|uniref:Uncharacterized protein n=3 Tax=Dioscorea alata TaxID=55571 RepID=A0ACB7V092_DIOAL|nr:hypothetical protein IHE45_12G006900 [Dioscorea alata]KAH7666605.1 hypothetical protein IHE45_12G006900 [Dioscorea alata]KAH7666606.1 hypothetical protein IHE45_12G006900 [Dioscorea alata]
MASHLLHLLPNPFISSFNPKNPNPNKRRIQALPPNPPSIRASLPPHPFSSPPSFLPLPKHPPFIAAAGRSKKNPAGRMEGNAEIRRQAKIAGRRRSRRIAQNLFYRKYGPNANNPDRFSDEELQMIGLGYDRMVRFMAPDDPRLRHPYDWYKYGQYGPYSWRGVVIGPPIRGRFSDERVTLIGEVRDHEEWELIEQFDMSSEFSERLESMDKNIGFRYFWVFVRHPKWNSSELPWQQWTLVAEVVFEAGKQRLDKWSLMGRMGNKARAMVTQCAAWFRPDIIYVKRPMYQCRFEPQEDFFKLLGPLLDPETESQYLFELEREDGRIELCTYFAGLCKIVRVNPKSYVDDVVNAYEKLSDEKKSKCLEFLLGNHPMELLHPWTKEWKAKLEELELGCDAPDDSDDDLGDGDENRITDWIEEEDGDGDEVIDVGENVGDNNDDDDDDEPKQPEELEENPEYWNEQWEKAIRSPQEMEKLVTKSLEISTKLYSSQMDQEQDMRANEVGNRSSVKVDLEESRAEQENAGCKGSADLDESREEWENVRYKGGRMKAKRSRVPPELFLRAAVRPFTYRNLVKEIVLTRHAIVEGDITVKD